MPEITPQGISDFIGNVTGISEGSRYLIEGLNQATASIQATFDKGLTLDPKVFEKLDGLTAELSNIGATAAGIKDDGIHHSHVHSLENPISSIFSWIYEHRKTVGLSILVFLIFAFAYSKCGGALIKALIAFGSMFVVYYYRGVIVDHWNKFCEDVVVGWEIVSGDRNEFTLESNADINYRTRDPEARFNPDVKPQMAYDSAILKSGLLLSYLFCFRHINVDFVTSKFEGLYSLLATAPNKVNGLVGLFEHYIGSLQKLINAALEWTGIEWRMNVLSDTYPTSTLLLKEVTALLRTPASDKDVIVNEASRTSQILQARITDELIKNKSDKNFSGDRVLLMQAKSKLEVFDRELEIRGAGRDVTRVPPKAFLFIGQPKIGKSYMLKALCTLALHKLLSSDPVALARIKQGQDRDYIFTRNSADKFWEGYYNQLVVLLDEVGMQRDVAGSDAETNEYMNLIKMVNDVVFPLLMANVEKKGSREFNSPLILGTSNIRQFKIESIYNRDAYDRRWIKYDVSVNPRYGNPYTATGQDGTSNTWIVPDFEKMRSEGLTEEDIALSRFLIFQERSTLFQCGSEHLIGEPITIDQVMERFVQELENRKAEMQLKSNQKVTLHDYFERLLGTTGEGETSDQKVEISEDVKPQLDDKSSCPCKLCTGILDLSFKDEDKFRLSDLFGGEKFADWHYGAFQGGWAEVDDESSPNFVSEPICLSVLRKEFPGWSSLRLMKEHGVHVRSQFLIYTDAVNSSSIVGKVKAGLKTALKAVAALAAIVGLFKLGKSLFGSSSAEQPREVGRSSNFNIDVPIYGCNTANECTCAKALQRPKPYEPDTVTGIMSRYMENPHRDYGIEGQLSDLNAQEVLTMLTKRSVYAIGDAERPVRGFGIFLVDNIFVMPRHYISFYRRMYAEHPNYLVHMRRLGDGCDHQVIKIHVNQILKNHFLPEGSEDIVAVYVDGRCIQKHLSIRKYLMGDTEIKISGEMIMPNVDKNTLQFSQIGSKYVIETPMRFAGGDGNSYTNYTPMHYNIATRDGDCGLPVAVINPTTRSHKIFGFHSAGSPARGVGYAKAISTQCYDRIVDHFSKTSFIIESQFRSDPHVIIDMGKEGKGFGDLYNVPEDLVIPGRVNLGKIDPPKVPTGTSIVPSPLWKKLGENTKTKPAKLRPFINKEGELVDPNLLSTLKYHRTMEHIDVELLDVCKNHVTQSLINDPMSRVHENVERRVLSFEDAVRGLPGVEGLHGIPRKTSAGYPRSLSVKGKGKRDFFGNDGDYVFDSKEALELKKNVEYIIGNAKVGKRENHVFMDFPKDERRPKEKVDAGKTRKISACPIDLAIPIRMYFGAFIQFFMYNRVYNESAVGVNVYSSEWDLIAEFLGKDNRIIAGDFGNYDGSLPYPVMVRFLDTVTEFYRDKGTDNEHIREVLFQDIVNSRHVNEKGVVYEWVGSNASGNPLTTVLNSWCNLVLLRYASLLIAEKSTPLLAHRFLTESKGNLKHMTYGDDNLISVNRHWDQAHLFTQDNYTKAFKFLGFEYTDEMKSGAVISQNRSIVDVSFLKRRWARNSLRPNREFTAPLDVDTIMESIQWTKKKDYDFQYVRDNCVNMIQELSMHEREVFNEKVPIIVSACQQYLDFTPIPNDYDECQALVLDREVIV